MTAQPGPYFSTPDYAGRVRQTAVEYLLDGLGAIVRYKNHLYMLPQQRETTKTHTLRVADESKKRIINTLPKNLHAIATHDVELQAFLHDVDEECEEIVDFKTETNPWFQEEMQQRGYENFPRRIASFWINTALVTAADDQPVLFNELLLESRKLVPVELQTRSLDVGEAIQTYDRLNDFFKTVENDILPKIAVGKNYFIKTQFDYCMTHYDDIEMKRTLLGACVKMDEKRLGTQVSSECEFEKLLIPDHGAPLLANGTTYHFLAQTGRIEPIIPEIVAMTKNEPHYTPFAVATINAAYETQIYGAPLKPFYYLDSASSEPQPDALQGTHNLWQTQTRQKYKENKHGLKKPARILSSSDVIEEYKIAQKHLAKGNVMLPYKTVHDKRIPCSLLQRDGFDLVPLI